MFSISISGFRVFDQTPDVNIRPLTIVTGGNSSGKTSFLSAIRMLSDLSGWSSVPASFNKEPFYLGSFDQIAHYRGGKGGRRKAFTFSVTGTPNRYNSGPRYPAREYPLPSTATISLSFRNYIGQPAISCFEYKADQTSVSMTYSDDWKTAQFEVLFDGVLHTKALDSETLPPPEFLGSQGILLGSVLDRFAYEAISEDGKSRGSSGAFNLSNQLRAALSMVPKMGFAGGPVRTRPLRTYDPTDTTAQSEGAHVPGKMAQMARATPAEWAKTRADLVRFGKDSGLYKDIEVRRLGRGDSDPFQLNVSINGPKRNVVDVGYGVSQAIPIIFELATRKPDQLYMMQQPEVHLHPEAQAALGSYLVSNIKRVPGSIIIETHSDFLIDRVRRLVREGVFPAQDVSILYFDRHEFSTNVSNLDLNDSGEILNPPDNYRSFFMREQIENLSL